MEKQDGRKLANGIGRKTEDYHPYVKKMAAVLPK
jgi:hypothetical protein